MIIDVHCHYTLSRRIARPGRRFLFEPGCERDGTPALDSCVSPRVLRQPAWRLTRWALRLSEFEVGPALDAQVEQMYASHLLADGPIDKYILLAFDWYHDDRGRRVPLPEINDANGSDIYTSNSMIRRLCDERPERFLFGASVHPYRENALDCIDEVFEAGACLLKWLPLHQNIDITDERSIAMLRHCARLGLPVLVHYNEEFTLRTNHPEWRPVTPALEVLRHLHRAGEMPTMIMAHVATPVGALGDRGTYEELCTALRTDFADAPLYADVSALGSWGKVEFLRDVARRQDLHSRLLFGSDFPVPLGTWRMKGDLGREYPRLRAIKSWPQRYAEICRQMGLNEIVLHQAADILPNVVRTPAAV